MSAESADMWRPNGMDAARNAVAGTVLTKNLFPYS